MTVSPPPPELRIYPAIDLKDGRVVRLAEGDRARTTIYGDDPIAQAEAFAKAGARYLHLVDLDGAFAGRSVNGAAVRDIISSFEGEVQIGGGVRDRKAVEHWLECGAARVVLGTAALRNPAMVAEVARAFPNRIVVGVDARDGMVAVQGWAEVSSVTAQDLAKRFADSGVAALLFTDVGRDGLLSGCNVAATVALARNAALPVLASGGVADLDDIVALRGAVADGVEGVIIGRALYDGRIALADALAVAAGAADMTDSET